MPYTKQIDRKPMNPHLEEAAEFIKTPGDLTYAITYLMHLRALAVMKNSENDSYTLRYSKLSQVRASAGDAYDEFYHVVMRGYEDMKRFENGPVSILDAVPTCENYCLHFKSNGGDEKTCSRHVIGSMDDPTKCSEFTPRGTRK